MAFIPCGNPAPFRPLPRRLRLFPGSRPAIAYTVARNQSQMKQSNSRTSWLPALCKNNNHWKILIAFITLHNPSGVTQRHKGIGYAIKAVSFSYTRHTRALMKPVYP
jgi:hypothetical protein